MTTQTPPLSKGIYPYRQMYEENPALARKMLIQTYDKGYKISSIAGLFDCSRTTVYDAIKRNRSGKMDNKSSVPHTQPKKVSETIEQAIIKLRKQTNYGAKRLMVILGQKGIKVHYNTIGKILKRNGLPKRKRTVSMNKQLRDCYKAPFYMIEIDTKHIADKHALPRENYQHIFDLKLPRYQFTAIDTFTRIRWLCYGYHNTASNGWAFMLYVLQSLRNAGHKGVVVFQSDNGQEFGGFYKSTLDAINERLKWLGAILIHIPKGRKYLQGHVERSHKSDDEEFYIPHLLRVHNTPEFIDMATQWLYFYNVLRSHQGKYLNLKPPIKYAAKLKKQYKDMRNLDLNKLNCVLPLILDEVARKINIQYNQTILLKTVQQVRVQYLRVNL